MKEEKLLYFGVRKSCSRRLNVLVFGVGAGKGVIGDARNRCLLASLADHKSASNLPSEKKWGPASARRLPRSCVRLGDTPAFNTYTTTTVWLSPVVLVRPPPHVSARRIVCDSEIWKRGAD